jgi:hypothetical protein
LTLGQADRQVSWFLAGLVAAGFALFLLALLVGGCGPVHATAQRQFVMSVHDDLGLGAAFTVVSYYGETTTAQNVVLPPNGDVTIVMGETPQTISLTGAIWSNGSYGFQQAVSYTDQTFGPFWAWHVLYPSGVTWGGVPEVKEIER